MAVLSCPLSRVRCPHRHLRQGDVEGVVRITAKGRHWAKNVERLCSTELAPLGESGGTVQLEIFAAAEMALLIEMIVYG